MKKTHLDTERQGKISFQGFLGAYSHLSCRSMFPNMDPVPNDSFEQAIAKVQSGEADLGMIPIENSSAGRVADIHHLLPKSGLFIIGEHYEPVVHHLLARQEASLEDIKEVHCHLHTVGQVRNFVQKHGLSVHVHADNAGAAKMVSEQGEKHQAAIASSLAGELYDLKTLNDNINDEDGNTTRFVVLSKEKRIPPYRPEDFSQKLNVTSLMFETHSVPASLYKALGGFATNGVNITKLESYITDASFTVARFYAEVDCHRDDPNMQLALKELNFFCSNVTILGTYPAADFRLKKRTAG